MDTIKLTSNPEKKFVEIGEVVSLTCEVRSRPEATIRWVLVLVSVLVVLALGANPIIRINYGILFRCIRINVLIDLNKLVNIILLFLEMKIISCNMTLYLAFTE